jgi:excisionase family DNA binding protein
MTDKTDQLKLLTVPEVAEMLSISKSHVHALRATGKLKFIKIGRSVRYTRRDIERFLKERTMQIR